MDFQPWIAELMGWPLNFGDEAPFLLIHINHPGSLDLFGWILMSDESRPFLSGMSFNLLSQGLMDAAGNSQGRLNYRNPSICGWRKRRIWSHGSVIESSCCSCRGSRFHSEQNGSSQSSVTPVPKIQCPALAPMGTTHMWFIHIYTGKGTHTTKINTSFKTWNHLTQLPDIET